jgi:hypothetical protein
MIMKVSGKPFVRAVKAFIYRDAPIKAGEVLSKTDFHEEYVWQGLVESGHLEEQDNGNAGKLFDERLGEDPQD